MTVFDWVNMITFGKREWDSFTETEQDAFNPYIVNRVLSMTKDYIPIVEMAQTYPMPNEKLYDFYKDVIPKKKVWSKYIKSTLKYDNEQNDALSKYFECSTREIKDYLNILEKKEIDVILNEINGYSKKKKKK